MASGMLLERLFVKVQVDYEDKGLKEADKDVDNLEKGVIDLSKALNLLTIALTGAATAGLYAFTGWDRQMSTLAIKAGIMRKEFSDLYEEQSRAIGRATGVDPVLPAQAFQRAHSQGFVGRDADAIVRASMILQRENIMDGPAAVDAAIAISKGSGGRLSPMRSLEQVVAAGQVGQGETSNYIMGAKDLAPIGRAIGIELNEMMAGFGVTTGQAASPEMARTSMRAAVEFLLKNPTAEARELMASRGTSIEQLKATAERSLPEFLEFIRDNFAEDEFFKLTGSVEGAKGLGFLIPEIETIIRNARAIDEKAPGVIDGIEKDSGRDFSSLLDKLNAAFQDFIKQYGKPFATMLRPFLIAMTGLLNGIIALNDTTGGLLMWIPAIVTALLALRLAVIASTRAWGAARSFITGVGGGGLFGDRDGDGKDRRRTSVWEIVRTISTAVIAFAATFVASTWAWMKTSIGKAVGAALGSLVLFARNLRVAAGTLAAAIRWLIGPNGKSLYVARFAFTALIGAVVGLLGPLAALALTLGGVLAMIGIIPYRSSSGQEMAAQNAEARRERLDNLAAESDGVWEEASRGWSKVVQGYKDFWTNFAIGIADFVGINADIRADIADFFAGITDFFVNIDEWFIIGVQEAKIAIGKGARNIVNSISGIFSDEFDPTQVMNAIQTELGAAGIDLYRSADGSGLVDENGNLIIRDIKQFLEAESAGAAQAMGSRGLTIHNDNEWTLTLTMPDGSTQTFEAIDETSNVMDDYSDTPADAINRSSQTFQIGG